MRFWIFVEKMMVLWGGSGAEERGEFWNLPLVRFQLILEFQKVFVSILSVHHAATQLVHHADTQKGSESVGMEDATSATIERLLILSSCLIHFQSKVPSTLGPSLEHHLALVGVLVAFHGVDMQTPKNVDAQQSFNGGQLQQALNGVDLLMAQKCFQLLQTHTSNPRKVNHQGFV